MLVIVNHWNRFGMDLSLHVNGEFSRCYVKPAGVSSLGWTEPTYAYATQAHIDAINALDSEDLRRLALHGYERVDIGELGADQRYDPTALDTLQVALEPKFTRKAG